MDIFISIDAYPVATEFPLPVFQSPAGQGRPSLKDQDAVRRHSPPKTCQRAYFFGTLRENTLACDVILVAMQRIGNVVCSFFSTVYTATGADNRIALPSNQLS